MNDYLSHHGILGQHWGDRNGPPYPMNPSQKSMSEKKRNRIDKKWVKKNDKKIRRYAEKATSQEMREFEKELRKNINKYNVNGKISSNYANAYNRKLAEMMNKSISGLETPTGRVVTFVAKRGEIGVYTAFADKGYDMRQVKNGVYGSGKIAYKKSSVNVDH